jgi:hypothetical protein
MVLDAPWTLIERLCKHPLPACPNLLTQRMSCISRLTTSGDGAATVPNSHDRTARHP